MQVLSNERAWGGVRRGGEEQDEREGDTHNGAVPCVIAEGTEQQEHSYWLVKTGARKRAGDQSVRWNNNLGLQSLT